MPKSMSTEFSIILIPAYDVVRKIGEIRALLPQSSVRIDPPHMTLLRKINCGKLISDKDLLENVGSILDAILPKNPVVNATNAHTMQSRFYGPTSVIGLKVSSDIVEARKQLIKTLLAKKYMIDERELSFYHPHMTITLGVPLGEEKNYSAIINPGYQISLVDFALLISLPGQIESNRHVRLVTSS